MLQGYHALWKHSVLTSENGTSDLTKGIEYRMFLSIECSVLMFQRLSSRDGISTR